MYQKLMDFFGRPGTRVLPLPILLMAGCAVVSEKPEQPEQLAETPLPPYYLRAELEDPFRTIDEAFFRVGSARVERTGADPVEVTTEPDLWARIVRRFEFADCPDGSRQQYWARWFGERPDYMERVLGRARPWLYDIAEQLEERNLPGELALLPIVESAYDPFAYSHGRASGAWQFLSATAREHGIEINEFYDGRRDVWAATRAALDYLQLLSQRFDHDWNLALAAYNGGQGRVARAIQRNEARNRSTAWHDLPLPRETLAYVPKMHGLACLFQAPGDYGFVLPEWDNQPRVARIELPGPTDVVILSALAELNLAELVALNAGLNRHLTSPAGPHHLIVPIDQRDQVLAVLPELNGSDYTDWQEIRVQRGDTLSGLAQRYNTSVQALREANQLNGDLLSIGQRLRLQGNGAFTTDPQHEERYRELASLQERLLPTRRFQHQVRPGESLWVIASNYRVSVNDIQRWNGLGQSSLIRPGQRLMIHRGRPGTSTTSRTRQYTVRNGDSLWLIARRHQVSVADLLRWNNLTEGSILRPGQTLNIRSGGDA